MKGKSIRKIVAFSIILVIAIFVFFLIIFPEKTINKVLRDISTIEFKLMNVISSWLPQQADPDGPSLTLASHRGLVQKGSVENSQQSINDSLKGGFRSIEIDISFSSDFVPFVFHGPDLALVGREGQFSKFASNKIKGLQLKNGQSIITLKEFCHLYGSKFEIVYLDIKSDNTYYKKKAKMIIREMNDYDSDNIVLIGFPWRVMREVKKALPQIRIGIEQKGAIANFLLSGNMVSLHYRNEFSYAEYKLAKFLGLDVLTWTVNDIETLKHYSKIFKMNVLTDLNVNENLL
jgi:glycerophosphoryl diester phosphodiesterase